MSGGSVPPAVRIGRRKTRMRPMPVVRPFLAVAALALAAVGGAFGGAGTGVGGAQATTPNDPGASRQWGLERIGAPGAWSTSRGGGVTIAVIDSGIAPGHPDLAGKVDALVDCVGHDGAPGGCVEGVGADDAGHGTHVAGIAAASTDNGTGVAGVAPDAHLLSVRALANVCDASGCRAQGTETDVAEAIVWAANDGAQVINLSLGSFAQALLGPGDTFRQALQHAWSRGAIPVLVAGNNLLLPGSLVDIPAVVVAATDRNDRIASYSSGVGNVRWAVAAPGGEADTPSTDDTPGSCESEQPNGILSTYFVPSSGQNTYACVAGTSMAAPHVSGALAVLLGAGLTPQQAVDRLLSTADDLGAPGRDNEFGAGRVNLTRAVVGLSATGNPGTVTVTVPSTTSTTVAPIDTVPPADTTPPPDPSGGEAPPDTAVVTTAPPVVEPGVTTPPVAVDSAAPAADVGPIEDSLPALPLTLAVLLVVSAAGGHAWRYLASTSWARRTPDR